jgi:regulatory protein
VSSQDVASAAGASDLDDALARCYRHLGRREHSVAELRARLERAKLSAPAIDAALAIVSEQGYLDDARYASMLAEDRRRLDGWGAERIRARLAAAGIDRELVEQVLETHDVQSELAGAAELLERRCRGALSDDRDRGRAFAILIRAGYDSDVAYEAIRAVARQRAETPPDT